MGWDVPAPGGAGHPDHGGKAGSSRFGNVTIGARCPLPESHPAAVLPLFRSGLLPSALVIGSMVPDLPYYLPIPVSSELTHSAAGVVGVDLLLGLLSFVIWHLLVEPLAVAVAPASLRRRLPALAPIRWQWDDWRRGLVLLASLVV